MRIDKKLIQGKIDIIERNLKFLTQYKTTKMEEFINSFKDVQAVKFSML